MELYTQKERHRDKERGVYAIREVEINVEAGFFFSRADSLEKLRLQRSCRYSLSRQIENLAYTRWQRS